MRKTAVLLFLTLAAPAGAQDYSGPDSLSQETADTIRAGIERGYGGMCSLKHEPVDAKGYYRCFDVGPYRFEAEYGKIVGFVVLKGSMPYPILEIGDGRARFTVRGPWMADLDSRMAGWWSDEAEGGRAKREAADDESGRAHQADDAVRKYMEPPQADPATHGALSAPPPLQQQITHPQAGQGEPSPQQGIPDPQQPRYAVPSPAQPQPGVPGIAPSEPPAQYPGAPYPSGYKPPWLQSERRF